MEFRINSVLFIFGVSVIATIITAGAGPQHQPQKADVDKANHPLGLPASGVRLDLLERAYRLGVVPKFSPSNAAHLGL
jgi:hypothetical protein